MKYYITATDINSRQYIFEINETIEINLEAVPKENITQSFMQSLLVKSQLSIEASTFNTSHLVALQIQTTD